MNFHIGIDSSLNPFSNPIVPKCLLQEPHNHIGLRALIATLHAQEQNFSGFTLPFQGVEDERERFGLESRPLGKIQESGSQVLGLGFIDYFSKFLQTFGLHRQPLLVAQVHDIISQVPIAHGMDDDRHLRCSSLVALPRRRPRGGDRAALTP